MLGEAKRTYSQLQKKVVIPGRLACMAVVEHDNGLSGGIGYILYVRHKNDKNNHRDTEARRILNKRFIDCCIKHTPESSLDRGDLKFKILYLLCDLSVCGIHSPHFLLISRKIFCTVKP